MFFLGHKRWFGTPCSSFTIFMGKSASTNVDGRVTTYDVTSGREGTAVITYGFNAHAEEKP